mgnify:CR=1
MNKECLIRGGFFSGGPDGLGVPNYGFLFSLSLQVHQVPQRVQAQRVSEQTHQVGVWSR